MSATFVESRSLAPPLGSRLSGALTLYGCFAFLVGASLLGSGFSAARLSVGSLQAHPYLLAAGIVFPFLMAARMHVLPMRLVWLMILLSVVYFTSTLAEETAIGPGIKLAASIVTIWTMALCVRGWSDFVAGATGMCLAVAALAVIGIEAEGADLSAGIESIENANRNAYSLYALPAILLGGYVVTARATTSIAFKAALMVSILASSLGICLNLNRSGWLGLFVIVLLLVYEKSLKAMLITAAIGGVLASILFTAFDLSHIENRVTQTTKGNQSDAFRWQIFVASAEIAMENPLLGVSPDHLPQEIATTLGYPGEFVETHNVIAHLAGGSGIVSLFLVGYIGVVLWRLRAPDRVPYAAAARFFETRRLMRYLLVLWFVRGMFSHEIIYSPSFSMAIGLCLGLCIQFCPTPVRAVHVSNYRPLNRPRPTEVLVEA